MLNNQMRGFQQRYVTGSTGPVLKGLQIAITAHKVCRNIRPSSQNMSQGVFA